MAWNDAGEAIVAGSGQVYVAPVGTTLPTTAEATLNAAFEGLGFHTEDGVTVGNAPEITELRVWQARYPIRRQRDTENFTVSFSLVQWNEVSVPLAFGGGAVVTDGGSGYKYTPPAPDDAIVEKALVVDVVDGSTHGRFVVPRGNAVEAVEANFRRTELATLPITFSALESEGQSAWTFYTDSTGFAAGS
jgi:hypothetical protein